MPCAFQSGAYYMEIRSDLPRVVTGVISVQRTTGRENPPSPLSGFECAYTPFAKGHVMALELGGPDIPANIVPQYGLWQGNGEWRTMEARLAGEYNGHLFAAFLSYNFASKDYAGQSQRFRNGEVFDWNHEHIPNRIAVFVLDAKASDHPAVAGLAKALSAPTADERAFAKLLNTIRWLNPETAPVLFSEDFYQYEMPDIDRDYWLGQHVFVLIDQWYEGYRTTASPVRQEPETSGRRTTRRNAPTPAPKDLALDDMTFTYSGAEAVKQALSQEKLHSGTPMWEQSYLNQTVTPEFCIRARFGKIPEKKWKQLRQSHVPFPYNPPQQ